LLEKCVKDLKKNAFDVANLLKKIFYT